MTLPLILLLKQEIKHKFSRPPFRYSISPMGIFLKIDNLPFWRGLLLIMIGSLEKALVENGMRMEGSGKDLVTFQKNSSL